MAKGFFYNGATDNVELTGSLRVSNGITGSLFGAATSTRTASTASFVKILGNGITVRNTATGIQLTGSGIPAGGFPSQILVKESLTDGDAGWEYLASPVDSSTGLYSAYFDGDTNRFKYTSAPLIFGTGFTGSASSIGGQTEGSPNTIVAIGSNQYLIIGDMLTYNGTTSRGAIVINGIGEIIKTLNTVSTSGFMQFSNGAVLSADGNSVYVAHNQIPSIDGQSLGNGVGKYPVSTFVQDSTFATNVNAAFDPTNVRLVASFSSGKVFVGHITTSNASYRFFHVLNANGTQDTGFTSRFAAVYSSAIFPMAAATFADGSAVISLQYVGPATAIVYDGVTIIPSGTVSCLLKVSSTGAYISHIAASGTANVFNDVIVDGVDPTKFLVAGDWSSLGGSSKRALLRFNNNMTPDSTWNTSGVGGELTPGGYVVKWVSPFYYLMQNIFAATPTPTTVYNGTTITNVVTKINYDGSLASGWTGLANNSGVRPKDLAALSNGEVIGVGSFTIGNFPKIGKWTSSGQINSLAVAPAVVFKSDVDVIGSIDVTGQYLVNGVPIGSTPTLQTVTTAGSTTTSNLRLSGSVNVASVGTIVNGNSETTRNGFLGVDGRFAQGLISDPNGELFDLTVAIGYGSHAEGYKTTTTLDAEYGHAEGASTIAVSFGAHAEGAQTTAVGQGSHTEGVSTTAVANLSHAEGDTTTTLGNNSHAEGFNTRTIGLSSHAEGSSNRTDGTYSHAEGASTVAQGISSHTEGQSTTANGSYSHAEGNLTVTIGTHSHAEGQSTTTIGNFSHAEGFSTTAKGITSKTMGRNTIAGADFQTVLGYGNIESSTGFNALGYKPLIVGAGFQGTPATRSNIFEVVVTAVNAGATLGRGTIVLPSYVQLNYATDAAAGTGNIPLGGIYHNAGAVRIRLT